jgi:hypothetical protein
MAVAPLWSDAIRCMDPDRILCQAGTAFTDRGAKFDPANETPVSE